jgi:hypothetical protein
MCAGTSTVYRVSQQIGAAFSGIVEDLKWSVKILSGRIRSYSVGEEIKWPDKIFIWSEKKLPGRRRSLSGRM